MSFRFDGAFGTGVRPASKPTAFDWARDETSPGAKDGTILTATILNQIVANLRRVCSDNGVSLVEASDDLLSAAVTAAAEEAAGAIEAGLLAAIALKSNLASPEFTGTPRAPTAAPGTNTTQIATMAALFAAVTGLAPLASPTFTGTPAVPTAAPGTNTTQAASTAFVQAAMAALIASAPGALDTLDELAAALGDDANFAATVTNALALKAPLASPTFTGTPTAPTVAGTSDNSTKLATTAFVQAVFATLSSLTLASQAEAEAGTENTKFMSALRVKQGVASYGFTKAYISGAQTITSGGQITLGHSLGVAPKLIICELQCTSAEHGYSVGDRIVIPPGAVAGVGASAVNIAFTSDATNLVGRFSSNGNACKAVNKSTGGDANLTNGSWQLYVRAYA